MSKGDTARVHYESARLELIQRIQLRDNALVLFLGAVGAIFGIAGSDGNIANGKELLLLIPYLSFGVTAIAEHHSSVIGQLGFFLAVELEPYYKKINEYAPQWDSSYALLAKDIPLKKQENSRNLKKNFLLGGKVGHTILLIVPSIVSLYINLGYALDCSKSSWLLAWWLGVLFLILSIVIIVQCARYRHRLYTYHHIDAELKV